MSSFTLTAEEAKLLTDITKKHQEADELYKSGQSSIDSARDDDPGPILAGYKKRTKQEI